VADAVALGAAATLGAAVADALGSEFAPFTPALGCGS